MSIVASTFAHASFVVSANESTVVIAPEGVYVGPDTTRVEVRLKEFHGLRSAVLWLEFDPSLVIASEAALGDLSVGAFGAQAPIVDNANGTVSLAWAHASPIDVADSVFFSVAFRPKAFAQPGQVGRFEFACGPQTVFEDDASPPQAISFSTQFGTAYVESSVHGTSSSGNDTQDGASKDQVEQTPSRGTSAESEQSATIWRSDALDQGPSGGGTTPTLVVEPREVFPNQNVSVSATLCNIGEETTSRVVALLVQDSLNQSQDVTLSAGSCIDVVFTIFSPTPGTYRVAIDDMTGEFTVLPAMPAPPPPPGGEVVPSAGRERISTATILAIVGAMLILIAALVFFFRRE